MTIYTKADWDTQRAALINDNTTGDISPADVRNILDHLSDSIIFPEEAGFFFGFGTANDSDADHDISIAAGLASTDGIRAKTTGTIVKQGDATWAAGTNAGGMASGESLPANGTVHLWAIVKADGTTDFMFNNHASSALAPTLPTDYLYKRRIASFRTNSSNNFRAYKQNGDRFIYDAAINQYNGANAVTAVLIGLSVPIGIKVRVLLEGVVVISSSADGTFYSRMGDGEHTGLRYIWRTSFDAQAFAWRAEDILTNTSGQIYWEVAQSGATITTNTWDLYGFWDDVGRRALAA